MTDIRTQPYQHSKHKPATRIFLRKRNRTIAYRQEIQLLYNLPPHEPNHLLFDFCRRPQNTFFINAETSAHKNRTNRVQTQHPDTTANTHLQVKVCIFFAVKCHKTTYSGVFSCRFRHTKGALSSCKRHQTT